MLAQTPPPTKSAAPAAKAPAVNPLLHPETLKARAPESFKVKFTTTKGDFVIDVHRDWSPLGADRFYNLVRSHFFNNASFFRIVPNFIVQFGIPADPKVSAAWENAYIKDDPYKPGNSNKKGTVVYATAGSGTRTTQFFINLVDNGRSLDNNPSHFTPFGEVTEGMDIVASLYSGYGDSPDLGGHGPKQDLVTSQGKAYLDKNFPKLDSIKTAAIMPTEGAPAAAPGTKSTAPATKSTPAPAAKK